MPGMKLLITGSGGFVGRALVERLLGPDCPDDLKGAELVLFDVNAPTDIDTSRCRAVVGSLSNPDCIASAFCEQISTVFHLASVPGGLAEREYMLGRSANIDGTLGLLEAAREATRPPRFVFASSIAVLGGPLSDAVDDDTPLSPQMTYGAHKQVGEILVRDFSRRGWVEGISMRLPGIVARPPMKTGQLSAFMSDIIRQLARGEEYTCPVSAEATMWLMSIPRLVDNFLHAATSPLTGRYLGSAMTLPALHLSIAQLVDAIAAEYGEHVRTRLSYNPEHALEQAFGRYPALQTPLADAFGFTHDGDSAALIRNALALAGRNIGA